MYIARIACEQAGVLARYPIHFHLAYDMSGSFVRKCSIHDTFQVSLFRVDMLYCACILLTVPQRCITVHWTHNLLLEEVVAYNSSGHCCTSLCVSTSLADMCEWRGRSLAGQSSLRMVSKWAT